MINCFFQDKCSKIVGVRNKVPCTVFVCKQCYIDCTFFEGPWFPLNIIFSEQPHRSFFIFNLYIYIFFFMVVGLTGVLPLRSCISYAFHQGIVIFLGQNRMLL